MQRYKQRDNLVVFFYFLAMFSKNLILCFYNFSIVCYNCIEPKRDQNVSKNKAIVVLHSTGQPS